MPECSCACHGPEDEDRSRAVVGREQLLLPERNLEPGMAPVLKTDGLQNATATTCVRGPTKPTTVI